jgi:phosphorylcholine metabolism protein LicD
VITFKDEPDGTTSVYRWDTRIMRINLPEGGHVRTTIFNSFESILLPTVEDTKEYILKMYRQV